MDVNLTSEYYHFVYDPNLYGFNTAYWRGLNGTPTLTGSNRIRITALTIVSKHQYFHGDFTFILNVAGAPTGLIRRWGLISPVLATSQNALYFEENQGVFQAVVVNDAGTATTYPITWNSSAWNGVDVSYSIRWDRNRVLFLINGVPVASFDDRNLNPGYVALPLSVFNGEPDNLDLTAIIIKHAEKVVQPLWELPIVSTITTIPTTNVESAVDATTLTESVTVSPQATSTPAPSVNDSTTTSESLSVVLVQLPNVNNTVTTTESVTVTVSTSSINISVNEATTTSESVSMLS